MPVDYDWKLLEAKLNPRKDKVEFEPVKHLFRKVAFDVYKPVSGSEKLWELRQEDDGKEYLVALYESKDLTVESQEEQSTQWTATADHEGKNVTLAYRDFPITRIAIAQHGVSPDRAGEFARFLEKRAADTQFITGLLASLPEAKRKSVMKLLSKEDS